MCLYEIVVMKASEITPLSLYKFADLVKEAGFPAVSIMCKLIEIGRFHWRCILGLC